MKTTIRRQVIKRCPYADEWDAGELVIVFDGEAPELHALTEQVDKIAKASRVAGISHESFTAAVAELVPDAMVTTTWSTGPWAAEVTEGAAFWAKVTPAG